MIRLAIFYYISVWYPDPRVAELFPSVRLNSFSVFSPTYNIGCTDYTLAVLQAGGRLYNAGESSLTLLPQSCWETGCGHSRCAESRCLLWSGSGETMLLALLLLLPLGFLHSVQGESHLVSIWPADSPSHTVIAGRLSVWFSPHLTSLPARLLYLDWIALPLNSELQCVTASLTSIIKLTCLVNFVRLGNSLSTRFLLHLVTAGLRGNNVC